jgi:DNA-binding transcriptional LysR family regulator
MISERMIEKADERMFSPRFSRSTDGHLKALPRSELETSRNTAKMETMQIRMIDLNLFRVFDAMMLYRSVRKASQVLSVTPSAVSHALSRLRQSIGDELFIPSEAGMRPTSRALELASAVREGLEKFELALSGKQSTPVEALRTFRIGATDYACMVILPSLVRRLARSSPRVDLQVFSCNRIGIVQQLQSRKADLMIGSFNEMPSSLRRSRLLREDEVIAVRSGHPLTCGKLTKERLNEFPQLVVTPGDSEQNDSDASAKMEGADHRVSLDRALGEFQKEKINFGGRTAVSVSTFAAVTPFLQLSNMLAILPRRLAMWVAANAPLSLLEPPSPSVAVDIEMLWDRSADEDRGLHWLMKQLAESVGDLG